MLDHILNPRRLGIAVASLCCLIISFLVTEKLLGNEDADKGLILDVWARRSVDVRTAHFQLRDSIFRPANAGIGVSGFGQGSTGHKDVRFSQDYDVVLADSRLAIECRTSGELQGADINAAERDWNSAFDNELYRELRHPRAGERPTGAIYELRHDITQFSIKPILWTFRMAPGGIASVNVDKFGAVSVANLTDGTACAVLSDEHVSASRSGWEEFWIDPAKDYVVRRYRFVNRDDRKVLRQIDAEYHQDAATGVWVPIKWKSIANSRENLIKSSETSVLEYRINLDVPDSAFQLSFPAGTILTDWTISEGATFLVLEDGRRRPLSNAELIHLESGGTELNLPAISWALYVNVIVVSFLLLFLVWRRRRSATQPHGPS